MSKHLVEYLLAVRDSKNISEEQKEKIYKTVSMKKNTRPFWFWFSICLMPVLAVALGQFLKWKDDNPEVCAMLYFDRTINFQRKKE